MINFEISRIILPATLTIGAVICILIGIMIDRGYWKPRIYRYSKAEVIKTLEYQKNKIDQLEREIVDKNDIISDYKGHEKVSRIAALKIIGVTDKGE